MSDQQIIASVGLVLVVAFAIWLMKKYPDSRP